MPRSRIHRDPTVEQEAAQERVAEAEIDQVVMFIDLVGSTSLKDHLGTAAFAAIRRHNREVEESVRRLDSEFGDANGSAIRVVKFIGDEVMVTCELAYARLALDAALATFAAHRDHGVLHRGRPMESRVGITAGRVYPQRPPYPNAPDDPLGLTVDVAARLVAIAQPSQILVSGAYASAAPLTDPHGPRYADGVDVSLKGVEAPERVLEVLEPNDDARGIANYPVLRPELKLLEEAVTNFLGWRDACHAWIVAPLDEEDLQPSTVGEIRDRYGSSLAGPLTHIAQCVQSSRELKNVQRVRDAFDKLMDAYAIACRRFDSGTDRLLLSDDNDRKAAVRDHANDFSNIFSRARTLQVVADQFIKQADGTSPPDTPFVELPI
jgi:class 3 adenylate cyclase